MSPTPTPDLRYLKSQELHSRLQELVRRERKLTSAILQHICEVKRRGLHLEMAYSSMYDYMVRGLGYSESSALRRLEAAKLFDEIPGLGEKIETGKYSSITRIVLF